MRAGACTVQQTLTSEAASVLKHSLSLARRRGHAQVTPLHVAATLLSSRVSLLRRACLKSQPHQASHPLQCRALELCFNVALNRLPTTPGPLLHGQPSLSNALIAALKRAQAHQRRGCIEQQQQQPLLAIKVELEQLILSILDDPSVSRVMREAGFSSTAVKNNLEDCSVTSVFQCYNSSGGIYSTPSSPPTETPRELINSIPSNIWHSHLLSYSSEQNPVLLSPQKKIPSNPTTDTASLKEDLNLVVEVLLGKKRRNTVIVGDSVSITESLVAELMSKVERGDVPEELKSVHFIKPHFAAAPLKLMEREEVEVNISDLKRKIENLVSGGRGIIIYTGDLKWTIDQTTLGDGDCDQNPYKEFSGYNPVNHLVAEIGRLLSFYSSSSNSSNTRVWLLATANYHTYMRCQMKQPPLDIQWALQAVSVPSAGLGLSLNAASVHETNMTLSQTKFQLMEKKTITGKEDQDAFTCCPECISNYEKDLGLLKTGQPKSASLFSNSPCKGSELPYWLKPPGRNMPEKEVDLKRKWSKLCQSLHQGRQNQNNISSIFSNQCSLVKNCSYSSYPWWPSYNSIFMEPKSISFADPSLKLNQNPNSVPRFRRQQSCHIEFNFSNGHSKCEEKEPNLHSLKRREDKEVKITLALGSSEITGAINSENLECGKEKKGTILCNLLQEILPWQSESIPLIVEALIDSKAMKKDIWLLIQGNDLIGKRRLALGLAESVFGSEDFLFDFNFRKRDNTPSQCREMLENALRNNDKLVLLLEDVDFAHPEFLKFLADGFRNGKIGGKKDGNSCQAIYILTKADGMSSRNDRGQVDFVIQMKLLVDEKTRSSEALSSDHKRKAEWDFTCKSKSPRKDEMENIFKIEAENRKKELTRQFSSNTLDLNLKAEEESEDAPEEFSPASSDLTTNDQHNPLSFLELIKNRFVFNRDTNEEDQMREMFFSKIKGSFEKVFGSKNQNRFTVELNVLEEISLGAGSFLDGLFERWLKDIFQTSLVNVGKKDGVNIMLCLGGNGDIDLKDGFQGSCLPKSIQVPFLD